MPEPVLHEEIDLPECATPARHGSGGATLPTASQRILIVDDNQDSATSMGVLLQLLGHETHTAHDGLEAIAAAGELQPDVVLLDIGLPKLNGYEVARAIRQQPWGTNPLLIAVTGWGQESDRLRSKQAGFDNHLVKPVEIARLKQLLAQAAVPPRAAQAKPAAGGPAEDPPRQPASSLASAQAASRAK